MRKTLLAIAAGYAVITAATMIAFVGLNQATDNLNTPAWLTIKLMLAIIGGMGGGYAAALIDPYDGRSLRLLAGLMTALSIAAIAAMLGSEPLWFQAALIASTAPAILVGGQVRRWQWLARRS